jgi:hypothetical protein
MWAKTKVGLALFASVALGSCAGGAPRDPDRVDQYVGWVRFVGEFALYSDYGAFENSDRDACVSGSLPLEMQRSAAAALDGKRVRIIAKRVPWVLPGPLAMSLNHQGSPITNWCGKEYVLFATQIIAD